MKFWGKSERRKLIEIWINIILFWVLRPQNPWLDFSHSRAGKVEGKEPFAWHANFSKRCSAFHTSILNTKLTRMGSFAYLWIDICRLTWTACKWNCMNYNFFRWKNFWLVRAVFSNIFLFVFLLCCWYFCQYLYKYILVYFDFFVWRKKETELIVVLKSLGRLNEYWLLCHWLFDLLAFLILKKVIL